MDERPIEKSTASAFALELFKFAAVALLIVVPIRTYVAQPFVVSGASMEPTFDSGEYLVVDQLSYRLHEPKRGDVIIFRYPKDPSKFFIKRIVGLPDETVTITGSEVSVINREHPEGLTLPETYLDPARLKSDFITVALSEGEYFVLGDNRRESSDSRYWGTLPRENIVGRAFLRLIPVARASYLPGQSTL
jgi:signal peptidase I